MTWSQTSPLVFQKLSGDAYQVAIPELKFNLYLSSEGQKGDLDPAELTGEVRGNEVFLGKNNQIHYILDQHYTKGRHFVFFHKTIL